MLKYTANSVCVPLSYIFDCSMRTSKFPSCWKVANVLAFFKKGDISMVSNYRPIALLSCVGKVFERIVYKHIFNFIFEHKLLYKFQSGFVPGHSTFHQMIEIYHRICLAMEDKEIMCMIFCDISKAFDLLWHKGLLAKIKTYDIKGKLLVWIENYLCNRKQKVLLKNSDSAFGTLKAGVPQGSVLGPLLFLMFINDIADEIQCLVRLFADDSSLMYSSNDAIDIERRLNMDLETLNDWSKQWLVDFNPQKTEHMVFNFRKDSQPINFKFNGQFIKKVDDHKHLGVTFSNNCKWSVHIDNIC